MAVSVDVENIHIKAALQPTLTQGGLTERRAVRKHYLYEVAITAQDLPVVVALIAAIGQTTASINR